MSTTPMTAAQWRSQLKKFDVPFIELPTFTDPHSGRDDETGLHLGPMYGCGIHHTGDDAPDIADRKVIVNGRPDLPGPLATSGLRDDGVIEMVTTGRANHFGGGDPDVLRAVMAQSYGDYPPHTDKHQGEPGAVDGNDHFYGLETYYSGRHSMTDRQYASAVGWSAAICDFHGWSAKSVIAHKEWSDYKSDPGYVDMKIFRRDVQRMLDAHKAVPTNKDEVMTRTPKITVAIQAGLAFQKALDNIGNASIKPLVEAWKKKQIQPIMRVLRDAERK
jgi:hypothetical protein